MSWITVSGENDARLEVEVSQKVKSKIDAKLFRIEDVNYLAKHKLPLLTDPLSNDDPIIECLRTLAASWDLTAVKPVNITSHRKFLGPFIVAFKKAFYPLISALFKEQFEKQRNFNAKTIDTITLMLKNSSK